MRIMKLKDIIISDAYASTIPREKKIAECRQNWINFRKQDRYIVVNHNNILVDGYIQYLVLKEFGIEDAEVQIGEHKEGYWKRKSESDWDIPEYRRKTTTYIYGKHPNSKDLNE